MKSSIPLLVATAVITVGLSGAVFAQGASQTVAPTKINSDSMASGYRASKVVGTSVVNESGDFVGNIDDLIITSDDKVPFAVLSVGGLPGMGDRHVLVPFSELQIRDDDVLLRGVSSGSLKNLPAFEYNDAKRIRGPVPEQNAGTEKRSSR